MGSNQAQRRELPSNLILSADLIAVDSLEQARMESGDLLLALNADQWNSHRIVELKDVTARPYPNATTVFKSIGIALEDVVCAGFLYEKAIREGRGRQSPLYS
jgi:ornithine cyclodeaminase/alanine dehydrogenase-like protein (mu-crystallin family)